MRWALAALALVITGLVMWRWTARESGESTFPIPGEAIRLQVEVLNGTDIDGLARRVTRFLRRRGIDVVFTGSGPGAGSTMVIVRRGDTTAAFPVRDALGLGQITVDPDPQLLLDVTVLLGPDAIAIGRHP